MVEGQKPSYDFSAFRSLRFQPIPGYEDRERIPQIVISQTDSLLHLYRARAIKQPEIARDYFQTYTLKFLDTAAQGAERAFARDDTVINTNPIEVNEAADFTKVVFAWMHYFATSQFLPDGFSRTGMLQAPATRKQFLERTTEIKIELAFIAEGIRGMDLPLEARPSTLRTHTFFHVGTIMPMRFPDNKAELAENERNVLNKLLKNTNVELP